MKNFVSALKALAMSLIVAAIAFPTMNCSAGAASVTELKYIIGNWYDTKGNLVLTIGNDYRINGCTVLDIDFEADTAALYKIRINEGNRYRDIDLITFGSYNGYHKMLVMNYRSNNPIALRKTKNPQYRESVGGVYLGMDKNQVAALYGQPSSTSSQYGLTTWVYSREGFEVEFQYGVVGGIKIYPGGNRRFDWSGLSANSSRADFEYKYNSTVSSRGNIDIGHGELIAIDNNGVSLRTGVHKN